MSQSNRKALAQIPEEILVELEALRKENSHLKKTVAELAVDRSILREAVDLQIKKRLEQAKSKQRKN